MELMLSFCSGMLHEICVFLASEPFIYLFGFIVMAITCKVFFNIIKGGVRYG